MTVAVETKKLEKAAKLFPKVLKQMQFEKLRDGQGETIWNIIRGKDTICILPTSGGKSATYQIPTLCLEGKTLVFSPLVALMKDQMESMLRKGLRADQISSGQTQRENSNALTRWQTGAIDFLLVSPERISNEEFIRTIQKYPPDLIVADEAHCVSQWADSFRPQYRILGEFISKINPSRVLALTATCTYEIEKDIREYLYLEEATKIINYTPRKNLCYKSFEVSNLQTAFYDIIDSKLIDITQPTIIYCATVKNVEIIYNELKMRIPDHVLMYHGQMKTDQRNHCQSMFMHDKVPIMVATNAFGLGVDKPNIRRVIHLDAPGNLEAYSQESGRGGRDGLQTDCILYYTNDAYNLQQWFIDNKYPEYAYVKKVYDILDLNKSSNDIVMMTGSECAMRLELHPMLVDACLNLLISNSIIERINVKDRLFKIKFLKSMSNTCSKNFKKYYDLLNLISYPDKEQFYEVGLNFLSDEFKVLPTTIMNQIKVMVGDNEIEYIPPFRGKPIKVLKSLKEFDADFLKRRRSQLYYKLKQVKDYVLTKDSEKQKFLQNYFIEANGYKKKR